MYTFKKYSGRNWAVYDPAGELVCVTVYKKGAQTAADLLNELASTDQLSARCCAAFSRSTTRLAQKPRSRAFS